MAAERTPLLFDLPKPAETRIVSAAAPVAAKPGRSRWIDRHSGILFNEAAPRTYRVFRDLKREARHEAVDLGNWQQMRSSAAADDRAIWAHLRREYRALAAEFHALQAQLGGRARLYRRALGSSGPVTYISVGGRRLSALNVRSDLLAAAGIRSMTMPIKRYARTEATLREHAANMARLSDAIDASFAAVQAAERQLERRRPAFIWPPLIRQRLSTMRQHRARRVEVVGPYCPTPHIQFEGWRIRMLAAGDALKASVITMNRLYNLRRNRARSSYGRPRRVRFGLISFQSRSPWLLAPLEWRLIKRAPQVGNVITTDVVKGLIRPRQGVWRETGAVAPVAKPDGRLNPEAVALCHQPEMFPLLSPFDDMTQRHNAICRRVLDIAAAVFGARPSVHPLGATPRAAWTATTNQRWWT